MRSKAIILLGILEVYLELGTYCMKVRNSKKIFQNLEKHLIIHLSLIMPRAKSECLLEEKIHRLLW